MRDYSMVRSFARARLLCADDSVALSAVLLPGVSGPRRRRDAVIVADVVVWSLDEEDGSRILVHCGNNASVLGVDRIAPPKVLRIHFLAGLRQTSLSFSMLRHRLELFLEHSYSFSHVNISRCRAREDRK